MKNQEKISKTISMGFSDITRHEPYDAIYPKRGDGGGDKEKYPAGSLYYPATDDEPAVITTKTLEGRTPTMVCIVPDGVLGENAVFAHISNNGSGMYFPYSTSDEPFILARLNTTATNITSNNSVIFDEDNVPILPPYVSLLENRLIVQPTTPGLEYEIMNVHRSGQDQEDTGYYGGFIQVNGEYSEKAKDYQRVYPNLEVLQKEDNLFTITHEDEYNKSKFGDSDVLVLYGNEFKGRTYNYLNSTTHTWNNGPISYTNEYATALELAAALKFQNKWSQYIDPEANKFSVGNIMSNYEYADEMAERDIARVFPWFVNLDNGYVGVGVNYAFSPLSVSRIDKNENIVEPIVFEQKFAAKTIRPALCDLYEGFDITFNKQWGESLLLNETNDNIIGVEFILEDSVDPSSLKVCMYDNDKQKMYSEQITSTHMTYMYKDMYDAGEISTEHPMRVTLQKRTEGAGTVRVKKIYALFDNDQRAEMYPTQFNNTYVKIIWKTEGGDDKLRLIEKYFPDANFRAALAEILGINEGDEITAEKIAATTKLVIPLKQIANLTGIEHFTELQELYLYYNQLIALDVSKNTALRRLDCENNQLASLDISRCTALTKLICDNNKMTFLDVSGCTALTYLNCYNNQLTYLDVSNNATLEHLRCEHNQLTSLDVSNNIALTALYCNNNQLISLDVSLNTTLTELACGGNQLTSLDVSQNTALTTLSCYYMNLISELNISNNPNLIDAYQNGTIVDKGDWLLYYTNSGKDLQIDKTTQIITE